MVDGGRLDQLEARPSGLVLVALRGPCYLGLRSVRHRPGAFADSLQQLAAGVWDVRTAA